MGFRAPMQLKPVLPYPDEESAIIEDLGRTARAPMLIGSLPDDLTIDPGRAIPVHSDPSKIIVNPRFVWHDDRIVPSWISLAYRELGRSMDAIDWPWPTFQSWFER